MRHVVIAFFLAVTGTGCIAPVMRSTSVGPLGAHQAAELWEAPTDLATRNLYDGPWGNALAPNRETTFAFVSKKTAGVSPGFTVTDAQSEEWSVKQGLEAKVEVVMSRILWAVGYHQPPVYYLARWKISGTVPSEQPEARFRPKHTVLKDLGAWSWHENPFVGTRAFNGLRVLMMILNESDLKDSNNSIYEVKGGGDASSEARRWYVVRDIGTALGETGRLDPTRNDPKLFARNVFITRVSKGVVHFNYRGRHQELADHITTGDVRWICSLLAQLSTEQWHDAFRAGGYDTATAGQFIARIREKLAEGLAL